MTAWVGFVNDQGKKFPLQYMVNIVKVSPTGGSTPASGKADTKGEWKINVPNNTVIRATV